MKYNLIVIVVASLFAMPVFAGTIDGSVWIIASKACSSQNQPLSGKERLQFADGVMAYIYQVSDSQDEICNQAQVYQRVIQTFSNTSGAYTEVSVLAPQALRTVCRNKQSGTTVSDKSEPLGGAHQSLTLAISVDHGFADIDGSANCIGGTLHFELKK